MTYVIAGLALLAAGSVWFWRSVWFFRNPRRTPGDGEGFLSPADGTVVYARRLEPGEKAFAVKKGIRIGLEEIGRETMDSARVLIGVFMSPFDVHYNRAPLSGAVESIRHHSPRPTNVHMGPMHLRTMLRRAPLYQDGIHILQNERTATTVAGSYRGEPLAFTIIQIAGRSVNRIDSYVAEGTRIERGEIFGMIRFGSQVDLLVPWREGMEICVRAGDRVRAGETVVLR